MTTHLQQQLRRVKELADSIERDLRTLDTQTSSRLKVMSTQVAELASVTITSGQEQVPAMALGATRTISVALTKPMPDSTYSATATLFGTTGILGSVVVDGITAQTDRTVTVQVRATGVLAAGGIVTVHAVRHS